MTWNNLFELERRRHMVTRQYFIKPPCAQFIDIYDEHPILEHNRSKVQISRFIISVDPKEIMLYPNARFAVKIRLENHAIIVDKSKKMAEMARVEVHTMWDMGLYHLNYYVQPGGYTEFEFNYTAPSEPGEYEMQFFAGVQNPYYPRFRIDTSDYVKILVVEVPS